METVEKLGLSSHHESPPMLEGKEWVAVQTDWISRD